MAKAASTGRRGKLNARTFAIMDDRGNIFVTVPVLLYKKRDSGYAEMAKYFTGMTTASAVPLETQWCAISPMNSSTNEVDKDDDD